MLRKDVGHFPRPLGIAYIFAQFLGGFTGAAVSLIFIQGHYGYVDASVFTQNKFYYPSAMIQEALGAFFVVFFYLTQTESKTVFTKEPAINCFIIASAYVGGRSMMSGNMITGSGAVLNPAIGVGINFMQLFGNGVK
jgi:glycerol uptake facilitator-like aquaporin